MYLFFQCTGGKMILSVPKEWQPKIDDVQFVLMTSNRQHNYSVTNADAIIQNADFNPAWKTVIFSIGWNSTFTGDSDINGILDAYMCRGNVNFIVRIF